MAAVTPAAGAPATTERHTYARAVPWSGGAAAQLMDVPSVFSSSPDSDKADASGLTLSRTAPPPLRCLAAMAVRRAYALRHLPYTLPAVLAKAVELAPLSLETQRALLADNPPARGELCWGTHWAWADVARSLDAFVAATPGEWTDIQLDPGVFSPLDLPPAADRTMSMFASGGAITSLLDGFPVHGQGLDIFFVAPIYGCNESLHNMFWRAAECVARSITDTTGLSAPVVRRAQFELRVVVPAYPSTYINFIRLHSGATLNDFLRTRDLPAISVAWDFTAGRLVTHRTETNVTEVYTVPCAHLGAIYANQPDIHEEIHIAQHRARVNKYIARGYNLPVDEPHPAPLVGDGTPYCITHYSCMLSRFNVFRYTQCPMHKTPFAIWLCVNGPDASAKLAHVHGPADAHLFEGRPYVLVAIALYLAADERAVDAQPDVLAERQLIGEYVNSGVMTPDLRILLDGLLRASLCRACADDYNGALEVA